MPVFAKRHLTRVIAKLKKDNFIDAVIFIIAAAILSASAIYLLFFDRSQNVENPGKDEKQENNAGEIILE